MRENNMKWPPPVDVATNEAWWNEFWVDEMRTGFGKPSASLLDFVRKPEGSMTAIDIASGNGRYALELAKLGYQTTALELTQAGVNGISERANKENLELTLIQGDFLRRNAEKHDFDLILCSGLLEEIPMETHADVITGFFHWSKPGALVINRYCLEIAGRGILVEDDVTIGYYDPSLWEIMYYNELKKIKRSKGGFDIRHGTIVARRK